MFFIRIVKIIINNFLFSLEYLRKKCVTNFQLRSHYFLNYQLLSKLNFQPIPAHSEVIDRESSQKQEIEHRQREPKPHWRGHCSTPSRYVQAFPKDVQDKILAFFKRQPNFLPWLFHGGTDDYGVRPERSFSTNRRVEHSRSVHGSQSAEELWWKRAISEFPLHKVQRPYQSAQVSVIKKI